MGGFFTSLVAWLVLVICAGTACAQNPVDDVYNWREPKAAPGVARKWPPYYKPEPMPPEHQLKYAMGWCTVRTPLHFRATPTYTIDPEDIIDVNKLPETTFTGKVAVNYRGQLLVRGEAPEPYVVIVHPDPQLSQVAAGGEALPEALKPGMYVCLSGKVNARGEVSEVTGLQLVLQSEEEQTARIEVGERQRIVARVAGRRGDQLQLRIKGDGLSKLSLKLADNERIGLIARNCLLAAAGDEVAVKGKLFRDADATAGGEIFAAEVRLKLADPIMNVASGRRRTGPAEQ